eukprot:TRINITY_DN66065_c0_g1_i1.p1 TRINITY_DN66065_c0_g1~~TRINITY_DN66065_c0_g1_i1.p1  ORF type:complete len:310 (-),score=33.41 TRINITY_DN66065_c0_g1_i1:62-991(-)
MVLSCINVLLAILTCFGGGYALLIGEPSSQNSDIPPLFVSVLSKRSHLARRAAVREAWSRANFGSGHTLRFGICFNDDNSGLSIKDEARLHNDLVFIRCEEGIGDGRLTRKTLAMMQHYLGRYSASSQLYMQIDDDTFVPWKRFRKHIKAMQIPSAQMPYLYLGAATPERRMVDKDPSSPRFQPDTVYDAETYPIYMENGAFIVGKSVVQSFFKNKKAPSRILANADEAVGVWVDMVKETGVDVHFAKIPGARHPGTSVEMCSSTWGNFPFLLYHGIDIDDLACLSALDTASAYDQQLRSCLQGCAREI